MCNNELLPYPLSALKATAASAVMGTHPPHPSHTTGTHPPLEQYRLHQLYNYAMQQRFAATAGPFVAPLPYPAAYGPRLALSMSLLQQRMLAPEEPKPQHSYIGLIAMAILSSPETKLVLSDIYQYILDNYPYFRSRGPGWRNSIRHNLSLNDCFIKAGRSANGKGHYWAIHPANVDDFKKGDFRRRKAQRKVRKHMGLAVDEEGGDSPSPPPVPVTPPPQTLPPLPPSLWPPLPAPPSSAAAVAAAAAVSFNPSSPGHTRLFAPVPCMARKRQFDVASLLAPDDEAALKAARLSNEDDTPDEDIDVVSSDNDVTTPAPPPAHLLLEHHIVSKYYEHLQHSAVRRLALQQHNQQQLQLQHHLQQHQQQLHQHLQQLQQQQLQQQEQQQSSRESDLPSTPSPPTSCGISVVNDSTEL